MASNLQNNASAISSTAAPKPSQAANNEKVLCQHCGRTATNGIRCRGWCLPDEY